MFVLTIVAFSLFSCGKENLTPHFKPITINELKSHKAMSFSYQINDTQIDEYAKDTGKFPLFGKLFKAIAVVLANSTISSRGGQELELADVDVDLNTLSSVDFELIQLINLDSINLSVKKARERDSLAFIDKLEIYAKFDVPVPGLEVDAEGFSKIVYYDRAKDFLTNGDQLVKFNISKVDWKQILETNKFVQLRPKMVINSVPLSSMKLSGSIDFSVKFDVGF